MTDRQAFYNEIAQDHDLDAEDVKEALDIAIHFLILRKSLVEFINASKQEKSNTIGIHVSDRVKAIDRLK